MPCSARSTAERIGQPVSTVRDAQAYTHGLDRYPELIGAPQLSVVRAAKLLDALDDGKRERLREMLRTGAVTADRLRLGVPNLQSVRTGERPSFVTSEATNVQSSARIVFERRVERLLALDADATGRAYAAFGDRAAV